MTGTPKYGIRTYGDQIAEVYDRYYASYEPAAIVALKQLAGGGRALRAGHWNREGSLASSGGRCRRFRHRRFRGDGSPTPLQARRQRHSSGHR